MYTLDIQELGGGRKRRDIYEKNMGDMELALARREMIMDKKEYCVFQLLFASSFFAFGLFQEFIACIYCAAFGFLYFVISMRRRHMAFYLNLQSIAVGIVVFMYLISCFYGVDAGMGWIGFQKNLTILFFLYGIMQMTAEKREALLGMIPPIGCVMTAVGLIAWLWEPGKEFFYMSQRLGGFFQYPNVYALFCLIGLIILTGQERDKKGPGILQLLLLVTGIFASGSRTVLLLMLPAYLIQAVRKKQWRKPLTAILLLAFLCAGSYGFLTGNVENIGRFLTLSPQSAGFLGRILQMKDGLRLCIRHPFGLGYLGYYFQEPGIQTGIYNARFVHNGVLQMALDIGIFPALLFWYAFGRGICRKNISFERRLILAIVGIHCLWDFTMEFLAVWFLIMLLMDCCQGREVTAAVGGRMVCYRLITLALFCGNLYLGIAMMPMYLGNPDAALWMLPFYTEAGRAVLAQETDSAQAEKLAEKILGQNRHIAEAYDVLAAVSYQKENFQRMAEYKKESVRLRRYDLKGYERCIIMLSYGIEAAGGQGDAKLVQKLMEDVAEVGRMLDKAAEETDPIAYQLEEKPDFTLKEEVEEYMMKIKRMME